MGAYECQKGKALRSFVQSPSSVEPQGARLKLFFAGDSLLHESVFMDARMENGTYDFGKQLDRLLAEVKEYDIAYYSQETILGGKELRLSGYPSFNSPQEFGRYMVSKGFNLVSTASNHCLDRGTAGIRASRAFWNRFDHVLTAGTNATEEEFRSIPSITVKGVKVALLSYTYGTNGVMPQYDWQVNYYPGHEDEMLERVKQASRENDVLIVAIHWGTEYSHQVNDEQRNLARKLAKAGATVIIGNHPHTVQPFEWIDGVPVFYAMGNLISSQIGCDRRTGLIGSLVIDINADGGVTVSDARVELTYVRYTGDESILRYDIEVIPYAELTDEDLPGHAEIEEHFRRIIKSLDNHVTFGLRDKTRPPEDGEI